MRGIGRASRDRDGDLYVLVGASGNIGRPLVSRLLEAGERVRAVTRDRARVTPRDRVEIVESDVEHLGGLGDVLDGARGLYLVYTRRADVPAIVRRAEAAGVERLVTVSSLLAETHPDSSLARTMADHERSIRDFAGAWTILRPWEFHCNVLAWAPHIRDTGVVRAPAAGAPSPSIDPDDISAVAARALREDGHSGSTYPLTGPADLTPYDKIETLAAALGRPLEFQVDAAMQESIDSQAPDEVAAGLMFPGVSGPTGPGPQPTVEQILGRPARSFQAWASENVDKFR